MNKIISLSITITVILVGFGIFFSLKNNSNQDNSGSDNRVEIVDGVQYVKIDARSGYFPRSVDAKAGILTKLIVRTNGTYDCSASLVLKSIGYQKILSQTGEEVIDLGRPKEGIFQGVCSMGMYNFTINFK